MPFSANPSRNPHDLSYPFFPILSFLLNFLLSLRKIKMKMKHGEYLLGKCKLVFAFCMFEKFHLFNFAFLLFLWGRETTCVCKEDVSKTMSRANFVQIKSPGLLFLNWKRKMLQKKVFYANMKNQQNLISLMRVLWMLFFLSSGLFEWCFFNERESGAWWLCLMRI